MWVLSTFFKLHGKCNALSLTIDPMLWSICQLVYQQFHSQTCAPNRHKSSAII